jgi:hypothetical protein
MDCIVLYCIECIRSTVHRGTVVRPEYTDFHWCNIDPANRNCTPTKCPDSTVRYRSQYSTRAASCPSKMRPAWVDDCNKSSFDPHDTRESAIGRTRRTGHLHFCKCQWKRKSQLLASGAVKCVCLCVCFERHECEGIAIIEVHMIYRRLQSSVHVDYVPLPRRPVDFVNPKRILPEPVRHVLLWSWQSPRRVTAATSYSYKMSWLGLRVK